MHLWIEWHTPLTLGIAVIDSAIESHMYVTMPTLAGLKVTKECVASLQMSVTLLLTIGKSFEVSCYTKHSIMWEFSDCSVT